jgi:hypothetical protein
VTGAHPAPVQPSARAGIAALAAPPFLAATGALVLLLAAGTTLGLFFGGIILVALILPALVLAEQRWQRQVLAVGAVVLPVAIAWLIPISGSLKLAEWAASVALLAAWALGIAGLACLLQRAGLPALFAAAAATLAALLWLSWPIWLAPWVYDAHVAARLIAPHPLLALNGILRGWYALPWAQHALAYPLTNLGDDVPYRLPTSIWPALLLHLPFALAGAIAVVTRRQTPPTPVDAA